MSIKIEKKVRNKHKDSVVRIKTILHLLERGKNDFIDFWNWEQYTALQFALVEKTSVYIVY